MKKIQRRVRDFMIKAGQEVPIKPTEPSSEISELRIKLSLEEVFELAEASGVNVYYDGVKLDETKLSFLKIDRMNAVLVSDAIADINYINYGTAVAYGIDMEKIEDIVHESNMEKFAEGSYRREDGKWMKPPTWEDPSESIKKEIHKQAQ